MLNSLLPSFFGEDSNGATSVNGSGGTPEKLYIEGDKSALAKLSVVPSSVTEQKVYDVARHEASIESNVELMKLWSQRALSAQGHALAAVDVRVNHAQQSMKNEVQFRQKLSKHGKSVLIHNIENKAVKENLDAYTQCVASSTVTNAL